MKQQPFLIRQGDIMLVRVNADTVPDDATVAHRDHGRVVLAYGETTGHAHAIIVPDVKLVTAREAEELRMWLLVETLEPVPLVHEEHDALMVPPGVYEVRRQREYFPDEIRTVAD